MRLYSRNVLLRNDTSSLTGGASEAGVRYLKPEKPWVVYPCKAVYNKPWRELMIPRRISQPSVHFPAIANNWTRLAVRQIYHRPPSKSVTLVEWMVDFRTAKMVSEELRSSWKLKDRILDITGVWRDSTTVLKRKCLDAVHQAKEVVVDNVYTGQMTSATSVI